jgi:hypothetical protein
MAITQKPASDLDYSQTLQNAFNDVDSTITTNGFLVGKIGRKVDVSISTTNVASDTETYAFSENSIALYSLKLIYTDGTRTQLLSAERIS